MEYPGGLPDYGLLHRARVLAPIPADLVEWSPGLGSWGCLSPHAGDPNNDGFQFQSYYISLDYVIQRVGFASETFSGKTSTGFVV